MDSKSITREQLCGMFDHTCLKPFADENMLKQLCGEAMEMKCAMVAVNSSAVSLCKKVLAGSGVHVGAAVSFPLGQTTLEVKLFETEKAISDGADEIDYVVNIGKIKDGNWEYIKKEMEVIVSCCRQRRIISKVIFENCYLTREEIGRLSEMAAEVCPDFIKTSTGFGTGGAKPEDILLMKSIVGDRIKVKAAGGIRNWADCRAMIDAGAERIGTSSTKAILRGFDEARR